MSPARLLRHRIAPVAASIAILACALTASWAVNENETVGFQTNHLFEQGTFGENIDVLNGGLNLSIPIGPKYKVSPNLSYQLTLSYGSKIWDHTVYGDSSRDKLMGRSNMGLGFRLHMGRIYKDIEYDGATITCTWYFVTPDGNQHELPVATSANVCTGSLADSGVTTDTNYYTAGWFAQLNSWSGMAAPAHPLTVTTSDGRITYEFGHFVPVGNLYSSGFSTPNDGGYITNHNRDFGGFYVTRIVDNRAVSTPAYVTITYDTTAGREHAISGIQDSLSRGIVFHNECYEDTPGHCAQVTIVPGDPSRVAVRTSSIDVTAVASSVATYTFHYQWRPINHIDGIAGCTIQNCPQSSTNLLTDIEYPSFVNQSGQQNGYHMRFTYETCDPQDVETCPTVKGGEIWTRTVPTGAVFSYSWGSYYYAYGDTRQLVSKSLYTSQADYLAHVSAGTWNYLREGVNTGTNYTNPMYVTVTDALNNDTVYHYAGTYPNPHPSNPPPPTDFEDGYSPDWNDGVNTRTEYYEGTGPSRRLLRAETRVYEGDQTGIPKRHNGHNLRTSRVATIFQDDGGRQSVRESRDWNENGLWRETVESGDDIIGTRKTRLDYGDTGDSELFRYREVTEGAQIVSRSDYLYDPRGNRILSIDRATLPFSPGTERSLEAADGDVITVTEFDSNNNPTKQSITDQADYFSIDECGALVINAGKVPQYRILYGWQDGGYLLTKTFVSDFAGGTDTLFSWKAIDRDRDAKTGLILRVRDAAQAATAYSYDSLGRVREITPPGTQLATKIQYGTDANGFPRKTTVRQGTGSSYDCDTSETADVVMTCHTYDSLGRVIKTQRRQPDANGTASFQTVAYGIDDRITFRSEWLAPGQSVIGTTYDYGDPSTYGGAGPRPVDPFGRARVVVTADGKRSDTTYLGNNNIVTIKGIGREDGTTFDATTTYVRDVWNRLIEVLSPDSSAADAIYGYDIRDNLTHVALRQPGASSFQSRAFEYDPLNRLHLSVSPEAGTEAVTGYDALGNVTKRKDASGNLTKTSYDRAGRVTTIEWQAYQQVGNPITPPLLLMLRNSYDDAAAGPYSAGRVTKVESYDGAGTLVATRKLFYQEADLPGRLSKEDVTFAGWPSGSTAPILYDYNNFGFVSRIDYPEGPSGAKGAFAVEYGYHNGLPTSVRKICKAPESCSPSDLATLTYNAAGGVAKVVTTPGGVHPIATQIDPDVRNRPASVKIGEWNGTEVITSGYFDSGAYAYDGAGNISQIGANHYGYDSVNRLVAATDVTDGTWRRQVFAYDPYGNMTERKEYNLGGTQVAYDGYAVIDPLTGLNSNRLASHTVGGSNYLVRYDPRGNTLKDSSKVYEVDGLNRVTTLRPLEGSVATELTRFTYEGTNRATKQDLARGLVSFYLRDSAGRLLSVFRRTAQATHVPEWVQHQVYVGDRLVALRESQLPPPPAGIHGATEFVGSPNSAITISWNANPTGDGSITSKYRVYRSPNTTTPTWTLRGETTSTSLEDSVTTSTWYKYVVAAVATVSAVNYEGYSSDVLVYRASNSSPPTQIPNNLKAVASFGRVTLSWDASSSGGYSGYHVYRGPGASAVRLTTLPLAHPSFVDQGLTNGAIYTYSVSAVRSTGQESGRSTEVQATPIDNVPPGAVVNVRAVGSCDGGTAVMVAWELGADLSDTATIRVFRTPWWASGHSKDVGLDDTYLDEETEYDETYEYWVVAVDTLGNPSQESLHSLVHTRPAPGVVPLPGRPATKSGDGAVTIRIPGSGDGIKYVRVYRKPNIDPSCSGYELVTIANANGAAADFTDRSVANGVAYDYALTNVDESDQESGFSAPALATPVGAPWGYHECVERLGPDQPSNWRPGAQWCPRVLPAVSDYRRLVARWQAPTGVRYQPLSASSADLGVDYLKGYRIYRYTSDPYNNSDAETRDMGFLQASIFDPGTPNCILHPDINCHSDTDCPVGDGCLYGGSNKCTGDTSRNCTTNQDCTPAFGQCTYQNSFKFCSDNPSRRCTTCDHVPANPPVLEHCDTSVAADPCVLQPDHTCRPTYGNCLAGEGVCTTDNIELKGRCENDEALECTSDDADVSFVCHNIGVNENSNWMKRCLMSTGVCVREGVQACVVNSDCFGQQKCVNGVCACETSAQCSGSSCRNNQCLQSLGQPFYCTNDADCSTGSRCEQRVKDMYLVKYQDTGANLPVTWIDSPSTVNYEKGSCMTVKAVHAVYANGQWIEVESEFTDNFNGEHQVWNKRCLTTTPNVCIAEEYEGKQWVNQDSLQCPDEGVDPPSVPTPTATVNSGAVIITWDPPGTCRRATLPLCYFNTAATDCAASEYCRYDIDSVSGHCYDKHPASCSTSQPCVPVGGAAMVCDPRESEIDGYVLYASDRRVTSNMSVPREKWSYHYRYPVPIARLDKSVRTYTVTGLAPTFGSTVATGVSFRVAAYDRGGRVSQPSPPTALVTPQVVGSIPAPGSVKNIVWQTYNAWYGRDGVKVVWLPGGAYTGLTGYRLWRSESADGPFCALIRTTDPVTGSPTITCKDSTTLASGEVSTTDVEFSDASVETGFPYFYRVTAVTSGGESGASQLVSGTTLPRVASPLSPPVQFKAAAPRGLTRYNGTDEFSGIYLSWCRNPAQEHVTSYKIYRATTSMGPFALAELIATVPASCMDGHHRCKILSGGSLDQVGACGGGVTTNCCDDSRGGNCKVLDSTVGWTPQAPQASGPQAIYYYVVTAVRGSGPSEEESAFSAENQGRPNYAGVGGEDPYLRTDIDEFPEMPCGPDVSLLLEDGSSLTVVDNSESRENIEDDTESGEADSEREVAPYQVIGEIVGSTPVALPRFVFYHADHLGSPRIMTDESGQILKNSSGAEVGRHHYMPFGEEKPYLAQGSTNTRQFTGHERDSEAGLDYMLARYYSSGLGRFLSVDPASTSIVVSDPQSWNRYAYVQNNPLAYRDATGMDKQLAHDQNMERSLIRVGYRAEDAAKMSRGAGAIDRGVTSNVILSPELHFGGRNQLNRLINAAISAYQAGDLGTGLAYQRMADHLSRDMHIHGDVNFVTHALRAIGGFFQRLFGHVDTLNPDSDKSANYDERDANADAEEDNTNSAIRERRLQTVREWTDPENEHRGGWAKDSTTFGHAVGGARQGVFILGVDVTPVK